MSAADEAPDPDRVFLAWLKTALDEDLRAKWYELRDIGWRPDRWKNRAIERELARRGLPAPEEFNY